MYGSDVARSYLSTQDCHKIFVILNNTALSCKSITGHILIHDLTRYRDVRVRDRDTRVECSSPDLGPYLQVISPLTRQSAQALVATPRNLLFQNEQFASSGSQSESRCINSGPGFRVWNVSPTGKTSASSTRTHNFGSRRTCETSASFFA